MLPLYVGMRAYLLLDMGQRAWDMPRQRRQNVAIGQGSCGQGLTARGWLHEQNATYSIHYSNMLVLFMAWMMGMYFVSSVLLMRMNLPLMYRKAITQVRVEGPPLPAHGSRLTAHGPATCLPLSSSRPSAIGSLHACNMAWCVPSVCAGLVGGLVLQGDLVLSSSCCHAQVLGDIQFKFYHQWFDFIFIISAFFFLAVFYTIESSRQPSSLKNIEDKKAAEHFASFHIH